MTDKLRDAAQQAVEALEWADNGYEEGAPIQQAIASAIIAIRAALAQQDVKAEQVPVEARHIGWDYLDNGTLVATYAVPVPKQIAPKLYTAPQPAIPPAQQDAQSVRRKFLANGTRFKMSFFQNEDGEGNTVPGTHVTCFEAFEDELDGRWVALVPAEDDCHLNAAPTPPAQQDVQAVPQDMRYTPGCVLVPNQVAWGIVGSTGHARKRAVDALRDLLNAAPTPPAQQDVQAVPQDHSDLYAQGWVNGTQVQSLIDWCNSGCAKRADVAFAGGSTRQMAYAIEHLVKRASNLETSEGVFVPRELLAKVANAMGLPYEEDHTRLRSKLLDILSFAAPAQRVPLRGEEIYDVCRRTLPGTTARFSFVPDWAIPLAHALIEAYERKNAQPKTLPAPLEQQGNPYPST